MVEGPVGVDGEYSSNVVTSSSGVRVGDGQYNPDPYGTGAGTSSDERRRIAYEEAQKRIAAEKELATLVDENGDIMSPSNEVFDTDTGQSLGYGPVTASASTDSVYGPDADHFSFDTITGQNTVFTESGDIKTIKEYEASLSTGAGTSTTDKAADKAAADAEAAADAAAADFNTGSVIDSIDDPYRMVNGKYVDMNDNPRQTNWVPNLGMGYDSPSLKMNFTLGPQGNIPQDRNLDKFGFGDLIGDKNKKKLNSHIANQGYGFTDPTTMENPTLQDYANFDRETPFWDTEGKKLQPANPKLFSGFDKGGPMHIDTAKYGGGEMGRIGMNEQFGQQHAAAAYTDILADYKSANFGHADSKKSDKWVKDKLTEMSGWKNNNNNTLGSFGNMLQKDLQSRHDKRYVVKNAPWKAGNFDAVKTTGKNNNQGKINDPTLTWRDL